MRERLEHLLGDQARELVVSTFHSSAALILRREAESAGLTIAAMVLTAVGFVLIAEYSGAPAHSTYVPAHLENGQLVPGTIK